MQYPNVQGAGMRGAIDEYREPYPMEIIMRVRTFAAAVALAGAAVLGGAPLASAADGARALYKPAQGPATPPECRVADLSVLVDPGALRCTP